MNGEAASTDRNGISPAKRALWLLFPPYGMAVIALAGQPSQPAQVLASISIVIVFVHAVLAYRWTGVLAFLLICLAVTISIENLGIATGFPYGHYHFTVGAALPHIGAVPIIVGPLYFAMGYLSWMIASNLLDEADTRLDRPFNVVALPVVAAFVMVQWDVVMDPPNSTLAHAWIWHDGGGYFGVPPSNLFGWYLTVWLFFQLFSLLVYRLRRAWLPWSGPRSRAFRLLPILLYLTVALCHAVPYLIGGNDEIVDAAGHRWSSQALHETTVVVMLFTMLSTSVLALVRWLADAGAKAGAR
jgi:uncharacterized membrane protein